MKIRGKYLGWSIVHFCFMSSIIYMKAEIVDGNFFLAISCLLGFFIWRFIKNMELVFI